MNVKNIIPRNALINIEIMSALDLIAAFAAFPLVHYADRRLSSSLCLTMVSASFLGSYYGPSVMMRQTFVQIGQFVNSILYNIMFVYSAEIYPTVIRSIGLGLLGGVSRITAMLPPLLLPFMMEGEAFLVLGLLAFIAGVLVWLLPETKGVEMTNRMEDGEKFNYQFGGLKVFKNICG